MSNLYSIGAVNQLADALENAGFTADDLTKLKQFGDLKGIKNILAGIAEIKYPEHLIDLDADPFIPSGFSVEKHDKGGLWKWDLKKISLYLSKKQKKSHEVGNDLRKVLAKMPVLNANVLDYLLAHPELIPEEWKGKAIFFWGTIYRNSGGNLYVRYLDWGGSEWGWDYVWLDGQLRLWSPGCGRKLILDFRALILNLWSLVRPLADLSFV